MEEVAINPTIELPGRKRRGQQRMSWLDVITDSINMSLRKFWEAQRAAVHGVAKSWTELSD